MSGGLLHLGRSPTDRLVDGRLRVGLLTTLTKTLYPLEEPTVVVSMNMSDASVETGYGNKTRDVAAAGYGLAAAGS